MGNVQVLNNLYFFDTNTATSPQVGSDIFDNENASSVSCEESSSLPQNNKLICEYCQEYNFATFHEQHVRICPCNPQNIRRDFVFQSQRNSGDVRPSSNVSLDKVPCRFCNEACNLKYKDNHERICPKNPENIKINCRHCQKTLNLPLYQSHIQSCEENSQQRRRSLEPTSGARRNLQDGISNLRRSKTNTDLRIEGCHNRMNHGIQKELEECSICLEQIKSNFDLTTLRCNHKFHKHWLHY